MKWIARSFIAVVLLIQLGGTAPEAEARPFDRPASVADLPILLPDLGFGGEALALNNRGMVVGDVLDSSGTAQAAIWVDHSLQLIPTQGFVRSTALDVNDHGLVVGQGLDSSFNRHGYTYWHGVFRLLRAPFAGGNDVQVRRVNAEGQIVGTAADTDGVYFAILWQGPKARPKILSPLSGDAGSFGHGLNNNGVAAGSSDSADGTTATPVVWNRRGEPRELTWQGGSAEAFAINDRFEVTGGGLTGDPDDPATQSHILVWRSGNVIDLGTLPGDDDAASLAISQNGIVVGYSASDFLPTDSGDVRAVVWLGHGGLRVLPRAPADNYSTAHDVNHRGQIAGLVGDASGLAYAAVWQLSCS